MNLKQKYGSTAMVAGASEGIGAAFATYLAAEGMDLVLIARRLQPLQQLAESLKIKYRINVTCVSCDLSDVNAIQQIVKSLDRLEINVLVYNAALSYIGPFINNSEENHINAARVNMITPLKMVHLFGGKMIDQWQRCRYFNELNGRSSGERLFVGLCCNKSL